MHFVLHVAVGIIAVIAGKYKRTIDQIKCR